MAGIGGNLLILIHICEIYQERFTQHNKNQNENKAIPEKSIYSTDCRC